MQRAHNWTRDAGWLSASTCVLLCVFGQVTAPTWASVSLSGTRRSLRALQAHGEGP